jgi:hypothetical protein
MPGKDVPSVGAVLPEGFWKGWFVSIQKSADVYPYLTLLTICVFALCLDGIVTWGSVHASVKKEKLRTGYQPKQQKARAVLKRQNEKRRAQRRQLRQERQERKQT